MRTEFTVEELTILPGGKVVIVGTAHGEPLEASQRGKTAKAQIEVEVASIGIADPPPERSDKQILSVRLLKGVPNELKGITLIFHSAA
jgi:hypothetical protein